jgi:hypothetical protein
MRLRPGGLLAFVVLLAWALNANAQEVRREDADSIEVAAVRYLDTQLARGLRTVSLEPQTHRGRSWIVVRSAARSQALADLLGASVEAFGCVDASKHDCPGITADIGVALTPPTVRDSTAEIDVEIHVGGMGVDTYALVREGTGWRVTRILRRRAVGVTRIPTKPF